MTDAAQDPLVDAFAHLRQATQAHAAPALRSRTQSAHQHLQRQPYPPTDSRDGTDELTAQPPLQQPRVRTHSMRPHTQYAAVANGRDAAVPSTSRVRSVSADGGQKGGDRSETHQHHGHQPSSIPRKEHQRSQARNTTATASAQPSGRATYNELREQQRLRQMELARRMAASTASSTSVAYMEMVSPVRPLEVADNTAQERVGVANGHRYTSERGRPREARGASRREELSSIMQEFDDELSRSAGEHERPSVGMSRDVAEMEDDDADDEAEDTGPNNDNEDDTATQPLPSPVAVRVRQNDPRQQQQRSSYPPFREEISSDASEHVSLQSPPSSIDTDGNPYFPPSGELYSLPSISLTPPASPSNQRTPRHHHHVQAPGHQRNHHTSNGSHSPRDPSDMTARGEWQSGAEVSLPKGFFSSWTFGFAAGCLVAGFGGMFMEELMEFVGVYLKNSSVTLSRSEQREMNRRLDVLQEELLNFRASTNDIEHQSQRMVQEVRSHLVKMKAERERHQQMIAKEMDLLRLYVQAITNELVEDEKKEIRKRLMETIADTTVEKRAANKVTSREEPSELPRDAAVEPVKEMPTPKRVEKPVEPKVTPVPSTVVEVEIAAAQDAAAVLFETLDEESVMQQIDKAISSASSPIHVLPASHTKDNETQPAPVGGPDDSDKTSFSWELFVLLAGIAIIAAAVGSRVQKANRRKNIYRARRLWRQQPAMVAFKPATTASGDDSEVETVEFFRTGSESGMDDREVEEDDDEDEDDGETSGYSEEQKEAEQGDVEQQIHEEERMPTSSEEEEYEFQPAQLSEENSEIEQIDESDRDEPPTPYRRTSKERLQLEERQRDESPVRRSPRIQERSYLSQMR